LELLRDELEDYDCLPVIERLRRTLAHQVLIARATTNLSTYTVDPARLNAGRREMVDALEAQRPLPALAIARPKVDWDSRNLSLRRFVKVVKRGSQKNLSRVFGRSVMAFVIMRVALRA